MGICRDVKFAMIECILAYNCYLYSFFFSTILTDWLPLTERAKLLEFDQNHDCSVDSLLLQYSNNKNYHSYSENEYPWKRRCTYRSKCACICLWQPSLLQSRLFFRHVTVFVSNMRVQRALRILFIYYLFSVSPRISLCA